MSPHCDFFEQQSIDTEEGRLRPDLIVHLPGRHANRCRCEGSAARFLQGRQRAVGRGIPRSDGATRRRLVHQIKGLSGKEYWKQFEPTPEFVVLFVPGESFFSAALEQEPTTYVL